MTLALIVQEALTTVARILTTDLSSGSLNRGAFIANTHKVLEAMLSRVPDRLAPGALTTVGLKVLTLRIEKALMQAIMTDLMTTYSRQEAGR